VIVLLPKVTYPQYKTYLPTQGTRFEDAVVLNAIERIRPTKTVEKVEGYSPFEILGLDLGEKDWRTLLGYPPVH